MTCTPAMCTRHPWIRGWDHPAAGAKSTVPVKWGAGVLVCCVGGRGISTCMNMCVRVSLHSCMSALLACGPAACYPTLRTARVDAAGT